MTGRLKKRNETTCDKIFFFFFFSCPVSQAVLVKSREQVADELGRLQRDNESLQGKHRLHVELQQQEDFLMPSTVQVRGKQVFKNYSRLISTTRSCVMQLKTLIHLQSSKNSLFVTIAASKYDIMTVHEHGHIHRTPALPIVDELSI